MNGYTKLFSSIVTSTIWREPKETKILWITMLALADKYGVVEGSIPGLADMARLSIPETQESLAVLHAPDDFSRTTDYEGRRIKTIDGGWQILNHAKYREKMNADERREYLRIKQQESRERKANKSTPVNNGQPSSTSVAPASTLSTHAECRVQSAEALNTPPLPPRGNGSGVKTPKPKPAEALSDEHFMTEIRRHYADIDLDREIHRMKAWQLTPAGKGKLLTRRRIVSWLNRCDAPVKTEAESPYRLPR